MAGLSDGVNTRSYFTMIVMKPYNLAPLISFIFLLAGGFYVIKKGRGQVFNWLFALAILSLAAMEWGNFKVSTRV